jgi:hypothetical protein
MPSPPPPAETELSVPDFSNARRARQEVMQQHAKEFRDALASLSEHVSQLTLEMQQAHSSGIFSVKIYKQTSEIEHLAKQLKALAKG